MQRVRDVARTTVAAAAAAAVNSAAVAAASGSGSVGGSGSGGASWAALDIAATATSSSVAGAAVLNSCRLLAHGAVLYSCTQSSLMPSCASRLSASSDHDANGTGAFRFLWPQTSEL